jgi:hypothetical protein
MFLYSNEKHQVTEQKISCQKANRHRQSALGTPQLRRPENERNTVKNEVIWVIKASTRVAF